METERIELINEYIERLQGEIWAAAQEMGVELSEDELARAARGTTLEEADPISAHLGMRAANLLGRAKDAPETTQERRIAGAQSSVVKAVMYLRAKPDLAAAHLQYARQVWKGGECLWHEADVPQMEIPAAAKPEAEEAEGRLRPAA
ncbi:MAG: hypothetical protein AAB880_02550 [Patescibacteria group bacterium]